MFDKETLRGRACSGTFFTNQERFLLQTLQRDLPLTSQRMSGWRNSYQRILHEYGRHQVHRLRRLAHHHQVGVIVRQGVQQAFTVGDIQTDLYTGIATAKFCQQLRHKIVRGTGNRNMQRAPFQPPHFIENLTGLFQCSQYGTRIAFHFLPCFGKEHPLSHLLKQGQSGRFFQLSDLHGNGRLGKVQLLGSTGKTQVPRRGLEDAQLAKGKVHKSKPYFNPSDTGPLPTGVT